MSNKKQNVILIVISTIIIILIGIYIKYSIDSSQNKQTIEEQAKPETKIVLTALGDIMCYNTQYQDAYNKQTNTYDFTYMFDDIKQYTQAGDITVGNLETTFGGIERKYRGYPKFNTPDELANNLKDIGIDLLTTANNHCLDTGYEGLERTIDVLDEAGISHLGTYKTEEDKNKPQIQYVKGIKIAFVNYTYGTNEKNIPQDKLYCVNLINKEQIIQDLQKLKEENPDVIVAMMHWGEEYEVEENAEQREIANYLFQNGVDIILGGHPHVIQPMEKCTVHLEDGTEKDGFIIYSLGNFTGDQEQDITKASVILNISITKNNDNKIKIDKINYIPISTYKNQQASEKKFRLVDIRKELETSDDEYLKKQLSIINQNISG